jgi:outer membrane protein assembly factor BamB
MKTKLNGWLVAGAAALLLVTGCGTPPDLPEAPTGPARWRRGLVDACTTRTTDPGGKQVQYQFDWGDQTQSAWSPLMDGGVAWSDTHTYTVQGSFSITVRARNDKRTTKWSAPLDITVAVGEGEVLWYFGYTGEDPEDSSDFSLNTFAMDADSTVYVGNDYGALTARKATGAIWRYIIEGEDPFAAAPAIGTDGTVYIGCTNDTFYAINPNGTRKWSVYAGGAVNATAALLADGSVVFQNEDSGVVCLTANGSPRWSYVTGGGNASPVVAPDGSIFVATQDGLLYSLDPNSGTPKWPQPFMVSSSPINATPALDPSRSMIYVVDDDGRFATVDFQGSAGWTFFVGEAASSPVVGADGAVYLGGGGKLWALDPDGNKKWEFAPPLDGVASAPCVTAAGYVYFLVTAGKKKADLQLLDSLYAVNSDGSRRWACGLGEGLSDIFISSPKVDGAGLIYVANGYRAWCVVGTSAPAASAWPMFQHDMQNSGRAR